MNGNSWLVAAVGLVATLSAHAAQSQRSNAERVLLASRLTLGDTAAITAIRSLETVAECRGPRTRYRTTVRSTSDGRLLFEQQFPDGRLYRAGLTPKGDWEFDPDSGRYTVVGALARTSARGHEIHMLVLAPEPRLGQPVDVRDTTFRGQPAVAVLFHDELGGTVTGYYARGDSLPLGFALPDHRNAGAPLISLVLSRWRRFGHLRLPTHAVYAQGQETYDFRFTRIRFNAVPDAVFDMPS